MVAGYRTVYVSVPDFTTDLTGAGVGGVSVIDPGTMKVLRTMEVKNCNPAGLALGPKNQALIGCSGSFGTAPNLQTQSLIIDITNTGTNVDDAVVARVPIGGNDEVWFDRGTRHYFLAGRNNLKNGKADPILGSDRCGDQQARSFGSDLDHRAFGRSGPELALRVLPIGFVPPNSPAGTDPTNPCPTTGCIAVFRAHSEGSDDKVSQREDDRFDD